MNRNTFNEISQFTSSLSEATKSLSHAHRWFKHVTFLENLWHSGSDSQCWLIFTRLLHVSSCSVKLFKHWQTPPLQTEFLSKRTHCSFISHGFFNGAMEGIHLKESLLLTKSSTQTHLFVSKSHRELGTSQEVVRQSPSWLRTMIFWKFQVNFFVFFRH